MAKKSTIRQEIARRQAAAYRRNVRTGNLARQRGVSSAPLQRLLHSMNQGSVRSFSLYPDGTVLFGGGEDDTIGPGPDVTVQAAPGQDIVIVENGDGSPDITPLEQSSEDPLPGGSGGI